MRDIEGVVSQTFEKDFHGTKLYQFKLEGSERWFKTGKEPLPAAEGDRIKFQERNGSVLLDTLTKVDVLTTSPTTSSSTGSPNPSEETPVVSKAQPTAGERMAWENARRDACNIVVAALAADQYIEGGVLPWAKNTAKAKRLDLLVGYINEIATQFMEAENGRT